MNKCLRLGFLLFLCAHVSANAGTNLYVPNNISSFLRWPITELGSHVYFLSVKRDSIGNGLAVNIYYLSSVNKYSYQLDKSIVVSRDTSFNIYEDFQPVSISYNINPSSKKINVFYVVDIDSSSAGSAILKYPKTINFIQYDTNLAVTVPAKPVVRFNELSRYAFWVIGFSENGNNSQTTLSYEVRDTLIDIEFNPFKHATKLLTVDDTGRLIADQFLGWEPTGSGTFFPNHSSTTDIYKDNSNGYIAKVSFEDSICAGSAYTLFVLDSNLNLIDTFDFPYSDYYGMNIPGKRIIGFGGYEETLFFLPSGSFIRAAIGAFVDSTDQREYDYYGLGKGTKLNGYRPSQLYFPPASDTEDYFHSANNGFYHSAYNNYDHNIYAFSSTKSDYSGQYCINDQPNLGELAAVDTNLKEKWVKYLYPRPGYCIETFSIAKPDGRNGVLISGREFNLNDLGNENLWYPFIYYVDSATRLGIDDPNQKVIITDQFSLYPNPATDYFTLENVLGDKYTFFIINMVGQTVGGGSAQGNKSSVFIGNLPPGTYQVTIQSAKGKHFTLRLLKK